MTRIAVQRAYQPSGDPTRRVGQVRSNTSGTPFSGTLSLPDAPLPFRSDAFFSHAQGKGSGSSCIRCRCRLQEAITEKQTMQGQEQKTMNSTGCKVRSGKVALLTSSFAEHPSQQVLPCNVTQLYVSIKSSNVLSNPAVLDLRLPRLCCHCKSIVAAKAKSLTTTE